MATVTPTTAVLGSHHQGRWYQHLYVQVLTAIVLGVLLGHFYPSLGEAMKPLGRCLHQDDQDAHCPDHLLHGRAWHRQHEGHEEGRPGRPEGAHLLRGRDNAGSRDWADRRQPMAAGCGHECRSLPRRHLVNCNLHHEGEGPEYHRVPDGDHSIDGCWCLCDR